MIATPLAGVCGLAMLTVTALVLALWLSAELAAAEDLTAAVVVPIVAIAMVGGSAMRLYRKLHAPDDKGRLSSAIVATERRFQELINAVPAQLWSARADGFAEFLNQQWLDYTGLSKEQSGGWEWIVAVHPDDRDELVGRWRSLLAGGAPGEAEARLRRHDGQYRWFLFRAEPVRDASGALSGWLGTNTDIDERKQAEQVLQKAQEEVRVIVDTIPALVAVAHPDGTLDFANAQWRREGFSEEDCRDPSRLIHPEDLAGFHEARSRSLASGDPYETVLRLRKASGAYRWHHVRGVGHRDATGTIVKRYAMAIDVHDRKESMEALRARERELQSLADTVPALIYTISAAGVPTFMNKRIEAYYGLGLDDLEEVDGSKVRGAVKMRVHPDDETAVANELMRCYATGDSFAMRYRNFRGDGALRWVDGRVEPLKDENGRIIRWYGIVMDIDDEIKAQEALRAAQRELARSARLASMAELSASIAHELNQPLAAAIANSHACQRWLAADPPNVQRARVAAERTVRDAVGASDLIVRIRALFRQSENVRTPVRVNDVVEEVRAFLTDEIVAERVTFETDLDPAVPLVSADRVQIQQVLVNLIRNAIEATRGNGDMRASILVRTSRDGTGRALTEVRDNGGGIADAPRIFDPLFTTKDNGMGMGLAICRSILEAHEGSIWVEKIEPRGSAFFFALPIRPGDLR